jgi:Tol biopolymer transport system component
VTLEPDRTLSRYRLVEKLGEGGMGVVWKAVDTSLDREVAVKILPDLFSSDPDRLARFEREAKLLASLNHPAIATVHGLEEADGIRFLVMELVPGEDLAARIARGPIPLDEALPIARQIAEALEAAHESGVVHRDLKPANVQVGPDGKVKVLDFGLAKALAPEPTPGEGDASLSPTLTAAGTAAGIILGTAAYMAPEQAKGAPVDRRADIWAFGVMLLEMLTGQQPFRSDNVSETLAAVILKAPELSELPPETPADLRRLLGRCLERDPRERLRDIGEARIRLRRLIEAPEATAVEPPPEAAVAPARPWLRWAVVALALAVGLAGGYLAGRAVRPTGMLYGSLLPPAGEMFHLSSQGPGPAVVSPDGTKVAFAARDGEGRVRLFVRPLDAEAPYVLTGTDGAQYPFWSPDSRFVAFFSQVDHNLKKIDVSGGPPLILCAAPDGKGGSWGDGGVILFAPSSDTAIFRVPASGGEPQAVTELAPGSEYDSHRHPRFLPGGRSFLFLGRVPGRGSEHAILAGSLDGGEPRLVLRAPTQVEYADGRLLFLRGQTLMAQPFDPSRLELTGEPAPVASGVLKLAGAAVAVFSASRDGVLVYQTGDRGAGVALEWHDRDGGHATPLDEHRAFREVRISPDTRSAAVTIAEAETCDIWIYDLASGVRTRFTYDPADDIHPVWTPGGESLVFASKRGGHYDLYRKSVGGTGGAELILKNDADKRPSDVSPDGSLVTYMQEGDLWTVRLSGEEEPLRLTETPSVEVSAVFSPDGRWLAYLSDESEEYEIYVAPFPDMGRRWQVSSEHGVYPLWRADGREIVYQDYSGQLHAVAVDGTGGTFLIGGSETLLRTTSPEPDGSFYSATPDHRRFLTISAEEVMASEAVTVVHGWERRLGG